VPLSKDEKDTIIQGYHLGNAAGTWPTSTAQTPHATSLSSSGWGCASKNI